MNTTYSDLRKCLVEVWQDNAFNGMGCLVHDKFIVTCFHILGSSSVKIEIKFPLLANDPDSYIAKRVLTFEKEDLAFLEIKGKPPESKPANLFRSKEIDEDIIAIFPPSSISTEATIFGKVDIERKEKRLIQLNIKNEYEKYLAPGLSGSPVWDNLHNSVIGIVEKHHGNLAFAISSDNIIKLLSILGDHQDKSLGVIDIIPSEDRIKLAKKEPVFLDDAINKIEIMGASLRSFWEPGNKIAEKLINRGTKGVSIDIYILSPTSYYIDKKSKAEESLKTLPEDVRPAVYKNLIQKSIFKFLDMKTLHNIETIRIWLYDEYPIWHMIVCDGVRGRISFYPGGEDAAKRPYYIIGGQTKGTLLEPLCLHLSQLKERSVECTWKGNWLLNRPNNNTPNANMTINFTERRGRFHAVFQGGGINCKLEGSSKVVQNTSYILQGIISDGKLKRGSFEFAMDDSFKSFTGTFTHKYGRKEECNGERV